MAFRFTAPVIATTGEESWYAVINPVTIFVTPGPAVAVHTPTFPVALAYPSAACAAACSCLISICRSSPDSISSIRESYMGMLYRPGIPNILLVPSLFRESTSNLEPINRNTLLKI